MPTICILLSYKPLYTRITRQWQYRIPGVWQRPRNSQSYFDARTKNVTILLVLSQWAAKIVLELFKNDLWRTVFSCGLAIAILSWLIQSKIRRYLADSIVLLLLASFSIFVLDGAVRSLCLENYNRLCSKYTGTGEVIRDPAMDRRSAKTDR